MSDDGNISQYLLVKTLQEGCGKGNNSKRERSTLNRFLSEVGCVDGEVEVGNHPCGMRNRC